VRAISKTFLKQSAELPDVPDTSAATSNASWGDQVKKDTNKVMRASLYDHHSQKIIFLCWYTYEDCKYGKIASCTQIELKSETDKSLG